MAAKEAKLTMFVGRGELTADELLVAYSHFLATGASRLTLWDLSAATLNQFDGQGIRRMARTVAQAAKGRRPFGKVAIVCGRPADFGKARMLGTYLSVEGHPVRFEVFTDLDSAKAWLTGEHHA
jgi:hypothetical protein